MEPENRLVAAELEAGWNQALEQVPGTRDADHRNGRTICTHPWDAPVQLKKRILANRAQRNHCSSERESRMQQVILHWAGGVHTELL